MTAAVDPHRAARAPREQAAEHAHDAGHHHRRRRGHHDGRGRRRCLGPRGRADPEPGIQPHHRALGLGEHGGGAGGSGLAARRSPRTTRRRSRARCPRCKSRRPSVRGNAQVVFGNLNWYTGVQGVTADYFEARDWAVVNGRPIGSEDVDGATKVVLLGQTTVQNLFGDSDPDRPDRPHQEGPVHGDRRARPQGTELLGPGPGRHRADPALDGEEEGARQEQLQSSRGAARSRSRSAMGEDMAEAEAQLRDAAAPAPPPAALPGRRLQRAQPVGGPPGRRRTRRRS